MKSPAAAVPAPPMEEVKLPPIGQKPEMDESEAMARQLQAQFDAEAEDDDDDSEEDEEAMEARARRRNQRGKKRKKGRGGRRNNNDDDNPVANMDF